jgi:secreted trypsin-like serine protease
MQSAGSKVMAVLLLWGIGAIQAHAVVVGKLPDTPERHVDPNVPGSPWAGVGSVVVGGGAYSGALVGRRYVLTAAHVVAGAKVSDVEFHLNTSGENSQRYAAKAVHVHPQYRGFGASGIAFDDLAIVELMHPVPESVPVCRLAKALSPLGTRLTMVGYGASGNGNAGVTLGASSKVKRVGANAVEGYIPAFPEPPKAYGFDFDSPDNPVGVMRGGTLGNEVETTLASGDSGSPAFTSDETGWVLFGINTFVAGGPIAQAGAGTFGTLGGGVLIVPVLPWIMGIIGRE